MKRFRTVSTPAFPVVGIGASAGGLEALRDLFSQLGNETGMAYVVVQHLAPTHESLLSEILSRHTRMPVRQATQAKVVVKDHVYVIPPNRTMAITNGALRLALRTKGERSNLPIDHFFRSLAESCGPRAIGIVLSGNASDGMLGLKAIKSAGGITFAQDSASAQCGQMPRSAAEAGAADIILPPAGIAEELNRLRDHAYVLNPPADPIPPTDAPHVDEILQLLRAARGADFALYKQSTIRRRIFRRMALARLERLADYVELLRTHRGELDALYDDVLINVTSFFRDPQAFQVLSKRVLPALFRRKAERTQLRIWVPGCSTGEEVYSLAICAFEYLGEHASNVHVQLFGTDVSDTALARARAGRYPPTVASEVSAERLKRFFTRSGEGYQVNKTLRDACIFARHNLLKDPPFSRIDVISCRNVLIYFGPVLQKKAVSFFHYSLQPDGFLMLGASENVTAYSDLFSPVDKKHKIFARRSAPSRLSFSTTEQPGPARTAEKAQIKFAESRATDLQHEADRIVMSRFVPTGVVVDADMDILQFRGRTSLFLEPRSGAASLNLMKMAREGLLLDLRSAFQKARREKVAVKREHVRMKTNGGVSMVTIEVIPFAMRNMQGRLYLVLFYPSEPKPPKARAGRKGAKAHGKAHRVEQELAATKDYLQTIIEEQEATNEEMMSANEEILSSNEELQSTNEELETAKEELQSSNEELSTLNDELNSRNGELHALNADLGNLLRTIQIPMVILDAGLRVRRATPAAERLLNLVPADSGRPMTDVRSNVELPDIAKLVHDVIETVTPAERTVRDGEGRTYCMRVRPYKTRDHKIDGVVIQWLLTGGEPLDGGDAGRDAGPA